jgi:hypothetical protein
MPDLRFQISREWYTTPDNAISTRILTPDGHVLGLNTTCKCQLSLDKSNLPVSFCRVITVVLSFLF